MIHLLLLAAILAIAAAAFLVEPERPEPERPEPERTEPGKREDTKKPLATMLALLGAMGGLAALLDVHLGWREVEGKEHERALQRVEQVGDVLADPDGDHQAALDKLETIGESGSLASADARRTLVRFVQRACDAAPASGCEAPRRAGEKPDERVEQALEVLARLNLSLDPIDRAHQDLSALDLRGLALRKAQMSDTRFDRADLSGAELFRTSFANASLVGAALAGANLVDADLHGARLSSACLADARLYRALLDDARLRGATLEGASLYQARCRRADFTGADLVDVDLTEASLVHAKLVGADLGGAILVETDLRHADLTGAIGVTVEQLGDAYIDEYTRLPADVDRSAIARPSRFSGR